MTTRTWPEDWDARRDGHGCPACAEGRPDAYEHGVRFFAGLAADAYLQRAPRLPGYSVVVGEAGMSPTPPSSNPTS